MNFVFNLIGLFTIVVSAIFFFHWFKYSFNVKVAILTAVIYLLGLFILFRMAFFSIN